MAEFCPFLMFEGQCEEALTLYTAIFDDSRITSIKHWPAGSPNAGQVMHATFELQGAMFMASDSPIPHDFTFTPSMSIYVTCADEAEFDAAFLLLAEGGRIHMSPADYGFSRKFGWTADRFGVSWQVNLP